MKPVVLHFRGGWGTEYSRIWTISSSLCGLLPHETALDTSRLGDLILTIFRQLGLWFHPTKSDFSGESQIEILGIVVDTQQQLFFLRPGKLRKVTSAAHHLLSVPVYGFFNVNQDGAHIN